MKAPPSLANDALCSHYPEYTALLPPGKDLELLAWEGQRVPSSLGNHTPELPGIFLASCPHWKLMAGCQASNFRQRKGRRRLGEHWDQQHPGSCRAGPCCAGWGTPHPPAGSEDSMGSLEEGGPGMAKLMAGHCAGECLKCIRTACQPDGCSGPASLQHWPGFPGTPTHPFHMDILHQLAGLQAQPWCVHSSGCQLTKRGSVRATVPWEGSGHLTESCVSSSCPLSLLSTQHGEMWTSTALPVPPHLFSPQAHLQPVPTSSQCPSPTDLEPHHPPNTHPSPRAPHPAVLVQSRALPVDHSSLPGRNPSALACLFFVFFSLS